MVLLLGHPGFALRFRGRDGSGLSAFAWTVYPVRKHVRNGSDQNCRSCGGPLTIRNRPESEVSSALSKGSCSGCLADRVTKTCGGTGAVGLLAVPQPLRYFSDCTEIALKIPIPITSRYAQYGRVCLFVRLIVVVHVPLVEIDVNLSRVNKFDFLRFSLAIFLLTGHMLTLMLS